MNLASVLKGSALAALAATMSLAAIPAHAKDGHGDSHRGQNHPHGQAFNRGGHETHQQGHTFRAPRPGPSVARIQSQPPRQQQQSWQRGNDAFQARRLNEQQQRQHADRRQLRQPDSNGPMTMRIESPHQSRDSRRNDGFRSDNGSNDRRGSPYNDQRRTYDRRDNHYHHWSSNDQYQAYRARDGRRDHWDRDWRNNHRFDWQRYRRYHRDIYRLGRYYAPYRDYDYRPLGIGFYLNSLFFGPRYWINDPWYYRLPPVSGDLRWIRYYDDAVLVDVYTGEVVDVIHNFFW